MSDKGTVFSELRKKRAVSLETGRELGRISDCEIELSSGRLVSMTAVRGVLFRRERCRLLWERIALVGEDAVLVEGEIPKLRGKEGGKKLFALFE